ncbi:hypothetical protein FHG87_023109 [Trinorchestia longiramus]|nr:hypothetical protein FHG87_023109 [Trinorchestia longiramus]
MQNGETVTDYLLRAETTASYLKRAGEMISDGLIIAMIIRGLPAAYNAFSTVVTQRDSAEMDFQKFKSALRSEEETKKTTVVEWSAARILYRVSACAERLRAGSKPGNEYELFLVSRRELALIAFTALSAHCFHLIVALLNPIIDHIPDHIPDHISDHILDPIFDHILDHYF